MKLLERIEVHGSSALGIDIEAYRRKGLLMPADL